jgi:hypothetical protein
MFSEMARLSTGQAMWMFSRPNGEARGFTPDASQNLRIASQAGTALTRGLQDVSREYLELSQKRLRRNLDGLTALAQCRSMADFIAAQTSLIRDNVEQTIDNSRRMAKLAMQMTDEATQDVAVQVDRVETAAQRVSRAA